MVKKTATPRSTQKTLTIDQELWSELESWLSSKQAKKLGYHSKAQFTTEAVRNLLEKYTSGKNIEKEILEHIDVIRRELADYVGIDTKLKLIETLSSSQTKNSDYVENLLQEARERLTKHENQKAYGKETQNDKIFARYAPKIEKISVDDDRVFLKDNIKNRIAEVVVANKELFCQLCDEKDCVHCSFVFSLPDVYEVLNATGIKQAKDIKRSKIRKKIVQK